MNVLVEWLTKYPMVLSFKPSKSRDKSRIQVNQNAVYQIYATTIAFYGPTMIMIILYVKMWLAAKRLTDQDRIAKKSINGSDRETSRNRKAHRPSTILQKIPLVILFYFFGSLFLMAEANSFRLLHLQWLFLLFFMATRHNTSI
uniref:G-protein coupled receptors family 1 profile domain-containing protein n=1 Tax=Parascaris equorum TaxID=6256 RepID=A0A914RVA1_PAREQ